MKLTKLIIIFVLAFAVSVSAQENPYPNELEGFEFFGKGKLKGLKLGFSTRDDVKKVFGNDCENNCDLNENWIVNIFYLGVSSGLQIEDQVVIFPKEELYDRIWFISLVHKKGISFQKVNFSNSFKFLIGQSEGCSSHGVCVKGPKLKIYYDSKELSYSVCKNSEKECKKDELYVIRYEMSNELQNKIFDIKTK